MMTDVTIKDDRLHVNIRGIDVLWALKSRLVLPLEHVVGARRDRHLRAEDPGSAPGARTRCWTMLWPPDR